MEHFYLIANPSKPGTREVAEFIADYLKRKGADCQGSSQTRRKNIGYGNTDAEHVPANAQCVITLGGDGTLIQAARDLVELQLPLIGVNMGHLGYLTQVAGAEDLTPMLDALLEDRFRLERRMMLGGEVSGSEGRQRAVALNDIVLTRQDVMQVLKFRVFVNGEFLNEYTADGMIVATPTGSTAYNLSAGGPIVAPGAELIVLTPICSHSLNSRSIVLSAQDTVSIQVDQSMEQRQMAVFDGDCVVEIARGERLEIKKAESDTTLIKLNDASFLDNLRNKMTRL